MAPQLRERFAGLGVETVSSSAEEHNRLVASAYQRLGELIRAAGLTPL